MSADISIDFGSIEALAARIGTAASSMTAVLATLDSEVSTLRGQWTGEASEAYDTAHASWTAELEQITAILSAISAAVDAAHLNYTHTEKLNEGRWS